MKPFSPSLGQSHTFHYFRNSPPSSPSIPPPPVFKAIEPIFVSPPPATAASPSSASSSSSPPPSSSSPSPSPSTSSGSERERWGEMLQRAASNAYSWWWASHIRTKQSKWLDSNLYEMEDRVKTMLKLIEEDADSFAKRAEMYFKRRPELINYVEDAYRTYRALAERYDHISGELHKANHTIATAFPDEVQYAMLEEEDDNFPKAITPISASKINKPTVEGLINRKREDHTSIRKTEQKGITTKISKEKAQEEINELQKQILVLQTEKEFIKSSYESGIAKYWEIEKQITEMQEEVLYLEDEFSATAVIEDDEARALMTATALKSCEDAIGRLEEQRIKSMEQAKVESKRIKVAKEKLKALKFDYYQSEMESAEFSNGIKEKMCTNESIEEQVYSLNKERLELQSICEKMKGYFELNPDTSVVEIAEKIDELVNKVITLELTVSAQTAQIGRLTSENNQLESYLQSLEEEKMILINDSNELSEKLKEAEEELSRIQTIEKIVQDEDLVFRKNFTQVSHSLNDISEKLHFPIHQDSASLTDPSTDEDEDEDEDKEEDEDDSTFSAKSQRECEDKEVTEIHDITKDLLEDIHVNHVLGHSIQDNSQPEAPQLESNAANDLDLEKENESQDKNLSTAEIAIYEGSDQEMQFGDEEDILRLHLLLANGLQSREKVLLSEYTSILRTYKETKRRLCEVEKKSEDYLHETMVLIGELKNANGMKDEEIEFLRQELESLRMKSNIYANNPFLDIEDPLQGTPRKLGIMSYSTFNTGSSSPPYSTISEKPNLESAAERDRSNYGSDIGGLLEKVTNLQLIDEANNPSPIEEKFRRDIDTLLEENLEFWLRFSSSFHHVQEFHSTYEDLQEEVEKLLGSIRQEGKDSPMSNQIVKPESAIVVTRLRALKSELQVWLEQSALIRGELQSRFSSLCSIQEEISEALRASSESGEVLLSPYQAAKFQGEVLNMKQENNKVANELQMGQDHVRALQADVEEDLAKLYEDIEPSVPKSSSSNHFKHFSSKAKVPLRAFLFGAKPKKASIFACMNPVFQKQYSDLRAAAALP